MNKCDAAFKKAILQKCYDALERAGFTRFAKEAVDWPISEAFHCWVGLNTGLYADRIELTPFVGVHAVEIERLVAAVKGRKYDRRVATYAVAMGELAGARDVPAFAFSPNQSDGFIESETKRLSDLFVELGVEYARSIASYGALLPKLQDRIDMLGNFPERVACCLYLTGQLEQAEEFTRRFRSEEPEYLMFLLTPSCGRLASTWGVTRARTD